MYGLHVTEFSGRPNRSRVATNPFYQNCSGRPAAFKRIRLDTPHFLRAGGSYPAKRLATCRAGLLPEKSSSWRVTGLGRNFSSVAVLIQPAAGDSAIVLY
jgi:hypothetical protein